MDPAVSDVLTLRAWRDLSSNQLVRIVWAATWTDLTSTCITTCKVITLTCITTFKDLTSTSENVTRCSENVTHFPKFMISFIIFIFRTDTCWWVWVFRKRPFVSWAVPRWRASPGACKDALAEEDQLYRLPTTNCGDTRIWVHEDEDGMS